MKFIVTNVDEHFGGPETESFDTLQEAEQRREEIMEEIFNLFVDEVCNEAKSELTEQCQRAIQIEEEE